MPQCPYKVLDVYIPIHWQRWTVFNDLLTISRAHGFMPLPIGTHRLHKTKCSLEKAHADLMRRRPKHDTADLDWHKDGDISGADMNCGLVLWASNHPTQFKTPDGVVHQPRPYEVVYVHNLSCAHRRPPDAPRIRWVFRQRVRPL